MSSVDVIIPFYNTPIAWTRQTLRSVVAQTYSRWRAFIVNDGSSEANTAALLDCIEEFADPRITYIRTPNRRLPAARNCGIAHGSAPYVAFLDSDDYWYPHKLERQVAALNAHAESALVYSANDVLWPQGTITTPVARARALSQLPPADQIRAMLHGNFIGVVTSVVRRTTLENAGGFDESFIEGVEDKELWIRLMLSGHHATFLDEALAVYRLSPNSMSTKIDLMLAARLRLIRKVDLMMGTFGAGWSDLDWPRERRAMLAHARHEAAGAAIDQGAFISAFQHIYSSAEWSSTTARLALRAVVSAMSQPLARRGPKAALR